MNVDAKTIYAQSSDIKSRTFLEYRRDMKQKAIAELEILPWLQAMIVATTNQKITVQKAGDDKFLWFLRKGGITREPDFIIKYQNEESKSIEFQYAKEVMGAYDFKISKVATKNKNDKTYKPKDVQILYVIKPTAEFALLNPEWVIQHGRRDIATAWGNAPVFRVDQKKLKKILKKDVSLKTTCEIIDQKIVLLDFQQKVIDIEKEKLSSLLQQVIDENQIIKILPRTLNGFYRVCFILDNIQKIPININLWIIYLLSLFDKKFDSYSLYQFIYCLDFLYTKTELNENEIKTLVEKLIETGGKIKEFAHNDGSFQSSKKLPPLEDTRYSLFIINIFEDLTQDILYYYGDYTKNQVKPINKIFQNIPDLEKTYQFITVE